MGKIIKFEGANEFENLLAFYGTPYMILSYAKGNCASQEFKEFTSEKYGYLTDKAKLLNMKIDDFLNIFAVFKSKCIISRILRICMYNNIRTLKNLLDTGRKDFSKMTCSKNYIVGPKILECIDDACKNAGYSFM